jgi:hypothetical protein
MADVYAKPMAEVLWLADTGPWRIGSALGFDTVPSLRQTHGHVWSGKTPHMDDHLIQTRESGCLAKKRTSAIRPPERHITRAIHC